MGGRSVIEIKPISENLTEKLLGPPYEPSCPSFRLSVGWSARLVWSSVCHNLLKGREVTLPCCSYCSHCSILILLGICKTMHIICAHKQQFFDLSVIPSVLLVCYTYFAGTFCLCYSIEKCSGFLYIAKYSQPTL